MADRAKLIGFNHVAIEVGDIEEALEFYGRLFEIELRGRGPRMAFIDAGDQFIALAEGRTQPPDSHRHYGLVVDDVPAVENVVTIVELSTGTPSTTKIGCDVPSIDFWPRMRMKLEAPGSPDDDVTTTPGAFAASAASAQDADELIAPELVGAERMVERGRFALGAIERPARHLTGFSVYVVGDASHREQKVIVAAAEAFLAGPEADARAYLLLRPYLKRETHPAHAMPSLPSAA